MCGIVGILSQSEVAAELHDSLIHLQHRGQDAAGIVTASHGELMQKKGLGLVREVFTATDVLQLPGKMGIAHVRYPTAGGYAKNDIQPLTLNKPMPVALAHNGNLVDYQQVLLMYKDRVTTSIDSEVLLHLLADQLDEIKDLKQEVFFGRLCELLSSRLDLVAGSYSVVCLIPGKGLLAFRDPNGIRPLVWGKRDNAASGSDYIFASETTPFYSLGFEPQGDLLPGEVAFVDLTGRMYRKQITMEPFAPCIFEYVYFARPDATLNNVSVYRARLRMGQNLAQRWEALYPDILPDVVIPAPFTANTAALSFANKLNVRYSEGLYKNPFVGRTFIMPSQSLRSKSVRYKLTPQRTEIEDKDVLILDDSIVRGTTSREIVKMVRESGAKKIYFVSSSPPITHPCFYGIDMPTRSELMAANKSHDEIKEYLGVDELLYQTQDDLVEAVTRKGEHQIVRPCMACMDGQYVCGNINKEKLVTLENNRKTEQVA